MDPTDVKTFNFLSWTDFSIGKSLIARLISVKVLLRTNIPTVLSYFYLSEME
jgi:hypothetical protein